MEKIITFTLDNGAGEQNLVDYNMQNIAVELEAKAEDYFKNVDENDEDFFEVTILIEKKFTQEDMEALPDYTG